MGWGGARRGAGRPKTKTQQPVERPQLRAEPKLKASVPAEAKRPEVISAETLMQMLPAIEELSRRYSRQALQRTPETSPFRLPAFPKGARPDAKLAMDNAFGGQMQAYTNDWVSGDILAGQAGEGLAFLGYTYLSELAQRPEYRIMSETIADDATRRWIDFDIAGDENDKKEQAKRAEKDPVGEFDRQNDPDEKKKRLNAAGKMDRVKQLQDHQEEIRAQYRFYEQCKNDGFFGRTHLYLDIRTDGGEPASSEENKMPIGNGRDTLSKSKCPMGSFKGLRTVEPVWSYPLMYNATNPLLADWYNPQIWYVMGQEVHGSRFLTFVGHPVPDMLKPAYAFGGLSLSQMAKPYVDIWLQTRSSVAALIHSFSVMVLMTDLQTQLQPGNVGALMARVAMFNMLRDNQGAFVVNKNTEDFKNVSASLSGLHELQSQSQEHMASVARIPLVKFTGIQPAGLNADSEGVIQVYDDSISGYQNRFMRPNLTTVIDFEHLHLWGELDKQITWNFRQLRELTDEQKAEKVKREMETRQGYIDMGAFSAEEIRKVAIDDPELPFADLNPEDVPEPPAEGFEDGEGGDQPGKGGEHDKAPKVEQNSFSAGGGFDADPPFAADATWNEADHPRGQPGNAGQFGSGGGGGGSKAPKQKQMGSNQPSGGKAQPGASKLYKAPTKSPDQIVAEFPGGAEAIAKTRERLSKVIPTDALVSEGGFKNPDGTYTAEREALHRKIANDFFPPEKVAAALPAEGEKPVLVMLGGRGGSGKSWLTGEHGPVDENTAILVDADAVKAMLPGYEGWNASAFHEESSEILKMIDQRALELGVNTIHDATMKSEATAAMRMAQYEAAGYEVEGYYMYAAPETAATRAMSRYSKGGKFNGRFVPPEIILGNVNNEKNFDKLSGGFRKWAVYDNNTPEGPKLVSKSWQD